MEEKSQILFAIYSVGVQNANTYLRFIYIAQKTQIIFVTYLDGEKKANNIRAHHYAPHGTYNLQT